MLIQPNIHELGDKRLNPEENLAKLKEGNAKLNEQYKIPGQAELEDVDKALGKPMSYTEVIRRIKLANNSLIVEDGGVQGAVAVRIPVNGPNGLEKKYITGFYKEVLPEFSYVLTDERGLPKREVRGWRSVLLMLIKAGAITLKQADALFGETLGQRAGRFQQQTRDLK